MIAESRVVARIASESRRRQPRWPRRPSAAGRSTLDPAGRRGLRQHAPASTATRTWPIRDPGRPPSGTGSDSADPEDASVFAGAGPPPVSSRRSSSAVVASRRVFRGGSTRSTIGDGCCWRAFVFSHVVAARNWRLGAESVGRISEQLTEVACLRYVAVRRARRASPTHTWRRRQMRGRCRPQIKSRPEGSIRCGERLDRRGHRAAMRSSSRRTRRRTRQLRRQKVLKVGVADGVHEPAELLDRAINAPVQAEPSLPRRRRRSAWARAALPRPDGRRLADDPFVVVGGLLIAVSLSLGGSPDPSVAWSCRRAVSGGRCCRSGPSLSR